MWQRIVRGAERSVPAPGAEGMRGTASRRAYYRVAAWIPVRLRPLAPEAVEAAIYDLSLPDPSVATLATGPEEASALFARLRRIEEKLDLLLGATSIEAPRPLSGRDRRHVVFSGAGLALDVEFDFRRGDAFGVELLLPAPEPRVLRAVGVAVDDAVAGARDPLRRRLALAFRHIEPAERDALVAYSYDIQRLELRAKVEGAVARA